MKIQQVSNINIESTEISVNKIAVAFDALENSLYVVIKAFKHFNAEITQNNFRVLSNDIKIFSVEIINAHDRVTLFANGSMKSLTLVFKETRASLTPLIPAAAAFISIIASSFSITNNAITYYGNLDKALFALRNGFVAAAGTASPYIAALAAIAAQALYLYNAIKHLPDQLGRITMVLSGQMSYWDALWHNLKENTFGFLDFTNSVNNAETSIWNITDAMNRFNGVKARFEGVDFVTAADIKREFENSSQGFAQYYQNFVNGNASTNEMRILQQGLQSRLDEYRDKKSSDYRLLENTLADITKQINGDNTSSSINYQNSKLNYKFRENINIEENEREIKLLSTRQQILKEIESIEKKIAVEDLPLQKKEFEKQIKLLEFRIQYLSGEYEKINLPEGPIKTVLPENKDIILPRNLDAGKKNNTEHGIKESNAQLRIQLGLIKSFEEAIPNLQSSFGGLFAAFVPPQGAADPFREFMKQIVLTFLNAVEIMLFEAGASSFFKAVLTGGTSLPKDVALIAAGLVALEAAKGFVGAFAKGTDSLHKSGYALVGEQGPELVYLNQGTKIFNNNDTNKMLNNARANQPSSLNVNNVYIASSLDALSFFRVNYPKYKKFKSLQAV